MVFYLLSHSNWISFNLVDNGDDCNVVEFCGEDDASYYKEDMKRQSYGQIILSFIIDGAEVTNPDYFSIFQCSNHSNCLVSHRI